MGVERDRETLHGRYFRLVLGVDWYILGYLVREELKKDMTRMRARIRTWSFERRLKSGEYKKGD